MYIPILRAPLIIATLAMLGTPVLAQSDSPTDEEMAQIVKNYADIGLAAFKDSADSAISLRTAIEDLLNNPSQDTLTAARDAWRAARIPFEQAEVLVLSAPGAAEWVDRVNAWPIKASFIDYADGQSVAPSDSIIGSDSMTIDGVQVDTSRISPELISGTLQHAGGDPSNIASGFHVIEFLLWGEDISGPEEKDVDAGAGQRPFTDFDLENCTGGNCARRGEYLYAAVNLLIDDLNEMVGDWQVTGQARRSLIADPETGVNRILQAMANLAYGDLAGTRLQKALLLHDPSAEIDQFSNASHVSYLLNARGLAVVYFGEYFTLGNDLIKGTSIADVLERIDPDLDNRFRTSLGLAMARMRMVVDYARDKEAFDLMIGKDNERGNGLLEAAISSLVEQKDMILTLADRLGIGPLQVDTSPALDNPDSIGR